MLNFVISPSDDLPTRTIKQAINQTAEGVKFSAAMVSVLASLACILFICQLTDFAALCLFLTACGAWCMMACLIRYDSHIQSMYRLYEIQNTEWTPDV